ncbi:MAG: T9SS type A sorting domain-containing protein [Bacteroidetes bacterium]|nr:T9SS type A sorting domain-containing protein [Bacteroidota bacterium]
MQDIQLYPNPTEGDVHIRYNAMKNEKLTVVITDITGKTVSTSLLTSKEGSNLIILPTDGMASGTYFIKMGNTGKSLKFVIK